MVPARCTSLSASETCTVSLPYTCTYVCVCVCVCVSVVCCLYGGLCVECVLHLPPSPFTTTIVLSQLSTTRNKVQRRKKVAAERGNNAHTFVCTHIRMHTHTNAHTCVCACDSRTSVHTWTHHCPHTYLVPPYITCHCRRLQTLLWE